VDNAAEGADQQVRRREFDEWFAANFDALVDGCRKRIPDARDYTASDAVMSAYREVCTNPPGDPIESPAAFLRLVAWRKYCRCARDHARAERAHPLLARGPEVVDPSPDQLSAKETVEFLRNNLTPIEQVVVQGRLDYLSNAQIAALLSGRNLVAGCGPEQVKAIWRKIVEKWRRGEAEG
jgi:DNA-directed RNA polymerase specialized sigma24 family protein